jgi:prevent-host-death family protein
MTQVNLAEAKAQLSRLVARAAAGEEITIAKAGKPVARLVPLERRPRRQAGTLAGKFWVSQDWDSNEVNDEIAREFNEGELVPGRGDAT